MPNLYDSLMERMDGRQYQNYFSAFCPFDTHKTPALLVYEDGWVCLSCHKSGSLEYLNRTIGSHYRPPERDDSASMVLPKWRKWERKFGSLDSIVHEAHKSLKAIPIYQSYLKRRMIHEYIDEGYLGYLDGWITFPVYSAKQSIIDIVVRSVSSSDGPRYVVHPGFSGLRPLYCPSWKKVNESDTVYVVYGIIDSISLHLAGLPVVTGVTGKSLPVEILKPLRKKFIIVPDKDEEKDAHLLANKLGWRARVKEIKWPEDCKDPDEIRKHFGNPTLLSLLGASNG